VDDAADVSEVHADSSFWVEMRKFVSYCVYVSSSFEGECCIYLYTYISISNAAYFLAYFSVITCFGRTRPSLSLRLVKTVPLYVKITYRVWMRCWLLIKIYLELRLYLKFLRCYSSLQSPAIHCSIYPRVYLLMLDLVAFLSHVTAWVFCVICAARADVDAGLLLA
jgi:hypothetical protein